MSKCIYCNKDIEDGRFCNSECERLWKNADQRRRYALRKGQSIKEHYYGCGWSLWCYDADDCKHEICFENEKEAIKQKEELESKCEYKYITIQEDCEHCKYSDCLKPESQF